MNIAIVGAGIVGFAVAYELASRGARVRLYDPRGAGRGATQASAGVLAPFIEGHTSALLALARCGLDVYGAFLDRVCADSGRRVEYRRSGTLQVALADAERRELADAARRLADARVPHSLIDGDEARRLEPALSGAIEAALLVPEHGYVDARALTAALADAAARHGATLSPSSVLGVDRTAGGLRIEAAGDSADADAVVLAAGSWSATVPLTAAPAVPVRPVRGQLLHLRLDAPPLERVVWGTSSYLVPWRDGSVLVGATVEEVGFDEHATIAGMRLLMDGGTALVPALHGARFEQVRVGLRPATSDELPVIGASPTMRGAYYATGHYRNGVLLAPLTAVLLGDLILDGRERPELALVRPERFGL